jgi:hypothetical protein
MTKASAAAGAFFALMLAGCAGQGLSLGGSAAAPEPAPVSLAGRWMLAAPNAPACGMNFAGAQGAREGTIAPEGGCPGNFFTSRRWSFDAGALVIENHEGEPLANLDFANGRFAGRSTAGTPLTLSRPPTSQ